ncbi:MAG: hypothetical protein NTX50_02365 [Candidatus Sumerlaeota bacterium]|nr:hypothetical protein [Candidatus Sumerlaeota bacterium]
MYRPFIYAHSTGKAVCLLPTGRTITVPIVPGILKHPAESDLPEILRAPEALRKYTIEALRRAPWQTLREFPSEWLMECLDEAALRPGRREALLFLLSARGADAPSS